MSNGSNVSNGSSGSNVMTMPRVAINGFGRIGRLILRAAMQQGGLMIIAINDIMTVETMAHLFKYDSTQGRYSGEVGYDENPKTLIVDGIRIPVLCESDPGSLPWKELDAQIVIESTGQFTKRDQLMKHKSAGAQKVLVACPVKEHDGTFVIGVNDHKYVASKHNIISIGSCTTNCLAPVCKVLVDSFGIEKGFMTTIHAYTGDQRILDAPHKDLRRARSAALSMIPTTTGAAKAISEAIPQLEGKMDGLAIRVPTPVNSLVDLAVMLGKEATVADINAAMKKAAEGPMKGVLEYCEDPIVSIDITGNSHSSIFDAALTMSSGKMAKVFSWYDNEWGFSCRMVEMAKRMLG